MWRQPQKLWGFGRMLTECKSASQNILKTCHTIPCTTDPLGGRYHRPRGARRRAAGAVAEPAGPPAARRVPALFLQSPQQLLHRWVLCDGSPRTAVLCRGSWLGGERSMGREGGDSLYGVKVGSSTAPAASPQVGAQQGWSRRGARAPECSSKSEVREEHSRRAASQENLPIDPHPTCIFPRFGPSLPLLQVPARTSGAAPRPQRAGSPRSLPP